MNKMTPRSIGYEKSMENLEFIRGKVVDKKDIWSSNLTWRE